MHVRTSHGWVGLPSRRPRRLTLAAAVGVMLAAVGAPRSANGGCGCDKPPPPRAAVRPFVGYVDQTISLFDDRLVPGQAYTVQFQAADGTTDLSRGKAVVLRDFADGQPRTQLRVKVGSVSLGPCQLNVWTSKRLLYTLTDDQFTVTAPPIKLHDYTESVTRTGYQAGVGRDGTAYIAVDVRDVNDPTVFAGRALDLPVDFGSASIAMYNDQGFLMQLLDPSQWGALFTLSLGTGMASDTLGYWRHEFRTYKRKHRMLDAWNTEDDPDWHADGTPHIDHDQIVIAVRGTVGAGQLLPAGATPPFTLVVQSVPAPSLATVTDATP